MNKLIIPPTLIAYSLILIFLCYFLLPAFNIIPFPYNLVGILVAFTGFSIMGKSHDLFKKYKTTTAIRESSHLITEGIFRRTRNPMYVGMFILLLGIGISFRNLFSILVPFLFLIMVAVFFIPKEEKLLEETFGEEFNEYKKKVRRWI